MTETIYTSSDKRIVRGPNVTQLMPAKYPWAWEWFLDSNKNHWVPGEVGMGRSIYQFEHVLTPSEKHIFITVFAYLTTSDILAMRNVSLAVMEKITAPEIQTALMRHGFDETVHCYADGTEILTTNGFKDFRNLDSSDRVAQYHNDGTITYVTPLEIIRSSYNGTVYEFANDSRTYVSVVTPGHRCVVENPRRGNQLEVIHAKDFYPLNYNIPVAGRIHNQTAKPFSAMDAFRVAFQADGTIMNQHVKNVGKFTNKRAIRFHLTKPRKIERIIELARLLGVHFTTRYYGGNDKGNLKCLITIWVPAEEPLDKTFEWVDITAIDSTWINSFFEELKNWDGCVRNENSTCYTNTNNAAIQKVALLAVLSNRRVGIYTLPVCVGNKQTWQLHIYAKSHVSGRSINRKELPYSGDIHCVRVPTGMVITRYEGCPTVSGNSWTYQHCLECLNLDANDIYTRYQRWPEMNAKFQLSNKYLKRMLELHTLETKEDVEEFIYGYIFFALIFEGVWFYNGFTPIFNMNRRQLMLEAGEQLQYILRDEVNHVKLGIRVIRGIIEEEGIVLDVNRIKQMFIEADACEENYIKMVLKDGMIGHTVELHMQQSKAVSNRRLKQLGLEPVFPDVAPPFKWLDEIAGGIRKEGNFFETKVKEYQSGAALDFGDTVKKTDEQLPAAWKPEW